MLVALPRMPTEIIDKNDISHSLHIFFESNEIFSQNIDILENGKDYKKVLLGQNSRFANYSWPFKKNIKKIKKDFFLENFN
jgi:hypothetical protein